MVMDQIDVWDPNNWVVEPHEYRIYGDNNAQTWAVVDEVDYQWAIQWCWTLKVSRGGVKCYLSRSTSDGNRGSHKSLYLHVEIMKRTGVPPPTPLHTITDHRNGNSMNCCRHNLRWATLSMNRRNLFGMYAHDLMEG